MACNSSQKTDQLSITVGMAVYNDFGESALTIQALRWSFNPINQIIVVDNNPNSRDGERFRSLCASANVAYIAFDDVRGTSAPRDAIFKYATGDVVVVIDPHIVIAPQAITALRMWALKNPSNFDLWSGPRVGEDLKTVHATHFDEVWGSDFMYGRWGINPRGDLQQNEPFEIPGNGLGLFACRRKAWLGFPDGLKGFGGEELMIHEKFRQAGRKNLCLPFLRWWHLFRDGSAPYPLALDDRFRNYLIWYRHLGLNEQELIERFRQSPLSRKVDRIVASVGAVSRFDPANIPDPAKPPDPSTLEGRFEIARKVSSDINEHCDTLRDLSSQCDHVVEFGTRHAVSTVALLAGQPKRLTSYDVNPSSEAEELGAFAGRTDYRFIVGSSLEIEPVKCDMLFVDTIHTKAQVAAEIARHAANVSKYLVFHDTAIFGHKGEDGGPGIMAAISDFLKLPENQDWVVLEHFQYNNGLLILSKDPRDKRPLPATLEMAENLAIAAGKYIAAKGAKVTDEQLKERLEICTMCRHRNGQRCAECGCPLERKAPAKSEDCRLGLWPALSGATSDGGSPAVVLRAPQQEIADAHANVVVDQGVQHRSQEPEAETAKMNNQIADDSNSRESIDCSHSGTIESQVEFSTKTDSTGASPPVYSVTVKCRCKSCGQEFTPGVARVMPL